MSGAQLRAISLLLPSLLAVALGSAAQAQAIGAATQGTAAAQSQPNLGDFARCDGFGAPNEHGDGMTRQALGFLGIFRPEPGRGDGTAHTPRFNSAGIAACDSALEQSRLAASYHLRRASLLRARAIHRMSLDQFREAILDLNLADREGAQSGTRLYDRSMGVGNNLLRAYALARSGQAADAAAASRRIWAMRPYSLNVAKAAASISLLATNDWEQFRRDLEAMADIHPQIRPLLFVVMVDNGDFADAIRLRAQIRLLAPRARYAGFSITDLDRIHGEIFASNVQLDAIEAFALAATGQAEQAQARIAAIRARLTLAATDLPNRPDGSRQPREIRDIQAAIQARLPEATREVDSIERLLRLLTVARAGDPQALLREAGPERLPADAMGLHILRTLAQAAQSERAQLAQAVEAFATQTRNARTPLPLSLSDLYQAMPGAETEARIPRYGSARNILGENTGNGFLVTNDGPVITVNYGGLEATAAVVEEMALLKAADLARQGGYTRLAILSRRTTQRTLVTYGMYAGGPSPEGFAAEITFVPFNAGASPEDYRAFEGRSLDAARVIADLAPIYRPDTDGAARPN